MSKSLKSRVAKLEEILGRNRGGALIMVNEWETKEEAMEKHFQEHPDHRDCEYFIFLYFENMEEAEKSGGKQIDSSTHQEGGEARENSAGRTWGDANNLTKPVQIDDRDALEEESPWPLRLDRNLPFETWVGFFCQKGVWFHEQSLQPVDSEVTLPVQPEKLDVRKHWKLITWKGKEFFIQEGWLFSRSTHKAIKF